MKILFVAWGNYPTQTGGVVIYINNLLNILSQEKHKTAYFYSGKQNLLFRPYLEKKQYKGIELYNLVNSPNFYDSDYNNPESDLENYIIEDSFLNVIEEFKPDIVHFHDFSGLCFSLIEIAKKKKCKVVVSHHNYFSLCGKHTLYNRNTNKNCIPPNCFCGLEKKSKRKRIYKRIELLLAKYIKLFKKAKLICKTIVKSMPLISKSKNTRIILNKKLTNNQYLRKQKKKRQIFIKKMFNLVDLHLAVSNKTKEIIQEQFNIANNKIKTQHIGTHAAETIKTKQYKNNTKNTITFGYLGNFNPEKGFSILAEAFKRVPKEKARLLVLGPINNHIMNQIPFLEDNHNIRFKGSYTHKSLQKILNNIDVGIVPSIWHDNAPQVVFEFQSAGIPVITTNMGGMQDFVSHNINGLIYEANNQNQLYENLMTFIEDPSLIKKMSLKIKKPKSIKKHTNELIQMYSSLLNNKK